MRLLRRRSTERLLGAPMRRLHPGPGGDRRRQRPPRDGGNLRCMGGLPSLPRDGGGGSETGERGQGQHPGRQPDGLPVQGSLATPQRVALGGTERSVLRSSSGNDQRLLTTPHRDTIPARWSRPSAWMTEGFILLGSKPKEGTTPCPPLC